MNPHHQLGRAEYDRLKGDASITGLIIFTTLLSLWWFIYNAPSRRKAHT